MSYQNFNRLPIVDQSMPLVTYTVEQNVYGDEEEIAGWFIVERSVIDGVNILPFCFGTHAEARAQLDDILA
jgi:hypothetical protein